MRNHTNTIITGPPSSGKSTLMRQLSAYGFQTTPEIPRLVITKHKTNPENNTPIQKVIDTKQFQDKIKEKQVQTESANGLYNYKKLFLDRSLIDNLAYRKFFNIENTTEIRNEIENRLKYYNNIYYLTALEFEDDGLRVENSEQQEKIGEIVKETYEEFGFSFDNSNIIEKDTIENRAQKVIQD